MIHASKVSSEISDRQKLAMPAQDLHKMNMASCLPQDYRHTAACCIMSACPTMPSSHLTNANSWQFCSIKSDSEAMSSNKLQDRTQQPAP